MADPVVESMSPWTWIVPINTVLIFLTGAATWLYTRGGKEAILLEQVKASKEALEGQVRASKEALDATTLRAERAEKANAELLERLHTHMLSDASAFAKLEALTAEATRTGVASEMRLSTAIDKLVMRIDGMSERFDTFITRIAPLIPQPPPQV